MIEKVNLTETMKDEIAVFLKAIDQKHEGYIKKLKTENRLLRERNNQLESFHEADKALIEYFSTMSERNKKANEVYKCMVERLEVEASNRPTIEKEFHAKVLEVKNGISIERDKARRERALAIENEFHTREGHGKRFLNQPYYDGYMAGIRMCLRHIEEIYK